MLEEKYYYSLLERASLAIYNKFNQRAWPYNLLAIFNCNKSEIDLPDKEIEEYHLFIDNISNGSIPRYYKKSYRDKVLSEVQSKLIISSIRSDCSSKVMRLVESMKDLPHMNLWEPRNEFNDYGAGI